MSKTGRLIDILRTAARAEGIHVDDWIYLQIDELRPDSRAILLAPEFDTVEDQEAAAAAVGFPREGLQASDVKNIFEGVARLSATPTDEQIIRAFDYYLRFDAYLPSLDAPDPPSNDKIMLMMDRQFYESLGSEQPDTRCKREGCEKGTVYLSLFCAQHHFENVRGRPYPL